MHGKHYLKYLDIGSFDIFVAISDGIQNNDAFKHTAGESHNETWTQLLLDLEFFEEVEDHISDLRRRFVFGAADWMAGNNGSLQNDKLLFGYTDAQWEYIWSTMLEDGAWAVPSITDRDGNVIKENFAPEIMIKYIAHDLRCHIIVFDLVLDTIQFISGNHLKSDNVVFDSPLMMYSTGSHFQSVFQEDHDFFVEHTKNLELKNTGPNLQSENNESNTTERCQSSELPTVKKKVPDFDLAAKESNGIQRDNFSEQKFPENLEQKICSQNISVESQNEKDTEESRITITELSRPEKDMEEHMKFEMIRNMKKKR